MQRLSSRRRLAFSGHSTMLLMVRVPWFSPETAHSLTGPRGDLSSLLTSSKVKLKEYCYISDIYGYRENTYYRVCCSDLPNLLDAGKTKPLLLVTLQLISFYLFGLIYCITNFLDLGSYNLQFILVVFGTQIEKLTCNYKFGEYCILGLIAKLTGFY
ncbi:hypothetical protein F4679DRAFT_382988 [Xylaria curta]|nr:hypothetical protein F4679DRAFT_382988 [Xylaria curta]